MKKTDNISQVILDDKDVPDKPKPFTTTFFGLIIGFLSASILYSQYLPRWVPSRLAESPVLFFGTFMLVCGVLGFNWGFTDSPESCSRIKIDKRKFPLNFILSRMFTGFLVAAVLYRKFMPSWVPVQFTEYPVLFFVMFTFLGAVIGYIWSRTEN
ncbi:hypothetical protein K8T06_07935 [bacterium]|nr:hypothetical protein [bacterium]